VEVPDGDRGGGCRIHRVANSTHDDFGAQGRRRARRGGRSGRRPGDSGAREDIAAAAERLFSERGFDRTTLRAVAAEAGVDPALITHYFGSKQRLFVEVTQLPLDPELVVAQVLEGPREDAGRRLAHLVLAVLESPEGRARVTGLVRSAASEPEAAALLRQLLETRLVGPLAAALGSDRAELRATLVGSQMMGLVMARYVIGVQPLASTDAREVAAIVAPVLQHYLVDPFDAPRSRRSR
jgi:AcrR family transcriptional regulator